MVLATVTTGVITIIASGLIWRGFNRALTYLTPEEEEGVIIGFIIVFIAVALLYAVEHRKKKLNTHSVIAGVT